MRLEASSMSDSTLGMDQLQKQLVNITLELQSLKKGKEVREEFGAPDVELKDIQRNSAQSSCNTL